MSRMIDAVRKSALPSNMMHFAARGALMVPPPEMIEILVYLAVHDTVFGPQAKMTLAGWSVGSCREILANPATPKEVLEYFTDPANLGPALLPALLENPSVGEDLLLRLARSATCEQVTTLVESARVSRLRSVLEALAGNPHLTPTLKALVEEKLSLSAGPAPTSSPVAETVAPPPPPEVENQTATSPETPGISSDAHQEVMAEPAAEIAAEADKPPAPVEAATPDSSPSSLPSPAQDSQPGPRMIDSIRQSALPSNMMQFAARGALMVPPAEMIEILVYLAVHNTVFGPQAKMTLAGWSVGSCREILAKPATPREVLEYFTDPTNLTPALLPGLLENPSVGEDLLLRLARNATREQVSILVESARASRLRSVLEVLAGSPHLTPILKALVEEKLSLFAAPPATSPTVGETAAPPPAPEEQARATPNSSPTPGDSSEPHPAVIPEPAAKIAAETVKPAAPVEATPSASPSSSPSPAQNSQRGPRMIDAIRKSALPSNMMQFAARGALMVPPAEMVEILVYLAVHNTVFGPQAKMTLAGWSVAACREILANPATPIDVLKYFTDPDNLRPALLPGLLENPSVGEDLLLRLARSATREQVTILVESARACGLRSVLEALTGNPYLTPPLKARIGEKLSVFTAPATTSSSVAGTVAPPPPQEPESQTAPPGETPGNDPVETDEQAIDRFMTEHAGEIAAEADKQFTPVEETEETVPSEAAAPAAQAAAASAGGQPDGTVTQKPAATKAKKWILSQEEQRGSALQKIAKLDIKGRILLAMKGNREERSLLVRDGTKIVALAVLESPRITDTEVERFASQRNVLEAVLRAISMKRRFIKQYPIVRNLTFNPRTPIDVSLGLIKNLLTQDLRHLAGNKEVSDTVRKLATKMFRQKLATTKKS